MSRTLRLVLLALALSPAVMRAQLAIPEIPYDAVDPIKLPDNLYLGEAVGVATNSKGNIFVYTRTGNPAATPARGGRSRAARRACSSSIRRASSSARSARRATGSSSPTRCASIARTTSGWWTKGRT